MVNLYVIEDRLSTSWTLKWGLDETLESALGKIKPSLREQSLLVSKVRVYSSYFFFLITRAFGL